MTKRLAQLQTASREPLTLVGYIAGSLEVERHIHQLFTEDRLRGEWFRLSDDLTWFIDTGWLVR